MLSEALRRALLPLLPAGVELDARRPGDPTPEVLPEENACVERAVDLRRDEFRAGRAAARTALMGLGIRPQPLLSDTDRAPIWPEGVVGSISHSRSLCIVVAARSSVCRSLGIDLEPDEPLEPKLWTRILTPAELVRLDRQPAKEQGHLARLVFSAKECFYKCQYPLTRQFLGFQDVEVELARDVRRFRATPSVNLGGAVSGRDSFEGSWIIAEDHIISCMALAPEAT